MIPGMNFPKVHMCNNTCASIDDYEWGQWLFFLITEHVFFNWKYGDQWSERINYDFLNNLIIFLLFSSEERIEENGKIIITGKTAQKQTRKNTRNCELLRSKVLVWNINNSNNNHKDDERFTNDEVFLGKFSYLFRIQREIERKKSWWNFSRVKFSVPSLCSAAV